MIFEFPAIFSMNSCDPRSIRVASSQCIYEHMESGASMQCNAYKFNVKKKKNTALIITSSAVQILLCTLDSSAKGIST